VKRRGKRTKPADTAVFYRNFWGPAALKRQSLLASLPAGVPGKGAGVPTYEEVRPNQEGRWRLAPHAIEGGFESWLGLDELFPINFQAVNPSRGLDGTVIDMIRPCSKQE
jgi:hypothetical protein